MSIIDSAMNVSIKEMQRLPTTTNRFGLEKIEENPENCCLL